MPSNRTILPPKAAMTAVFDMVTLNPMKLIAQIISLPAVDTPTIPNTLRMGSSQKKIIKEIIKKKNATANHRFFLTKRTRFGSV